MKARIKATGEIVSVKVVGIGCDYKGRQFFVYEDDKRRCFADNELDFDNLEYPDYWTRLEHQAAIAAMGGICGNTSYDEFTWEIRAEDAIRAAHALVEKMKEEK